MSARLPRYPNASSAIASTYSEGHHASSPPVRPSITARWAEEGSQRPRVRRHTHTSILPLSGSEDEDEGGRSDDDSPPFARAPLRRAATNDLPMRGGWGAARGRDRGDGSDDSG